MIALVVVVLVVVVLGFVVALTLLFVFARRELGEIRQAAERIELAAGRLMPWRSPLVTAGAEPPAARPASTPSTYVSSSHRPFGHPDWT